MPTRIFWANLTRFSLQGRLGRLVTGGPAAQPNATVYTQAEVRDLVAYSYARGVRVIPGARQLPSLHNSPLVLV